MSAHVCSDCGHMCGRPPPRDLAGKVLVDERRYQALERLAACAVLVEESYEGVRKYQTYRFGTALDALRQAHLDLILLETR